VLDYLLRRLLLLIPTFLGVSLILWLVLTLAPGEPGVTQGAGGAMGREAPDNLQHLETGNQAQRIFRRQFALDRPRFLNDWMTMSRDDGEGGKAEVRETVEVVAAGVARAGAEAVRDARRKLEDWGTYAVPSLVNLLDETEGELQTEVLDWLRVSAYTFRHRYAAGEKPSEADLARDRAVDEENRVIGRPEFRWARDAAPEARAPVVAAWRAWYEERRERWQTEFWEDVKTALTDTQFATYWSKLLRFDLGMSLVDKEPVGTKILSRLKYSLSIAVPSFLIAWILAIFLGVFSATRHGTATDQGIGVGLYVLYSIPAFVMGTVLQRLLAVNWGWFPVDRFESPGAEHMNTWAHFKDVLWHVTLPIVCYTYGSLAYISRQARSGMLQVMRADFVRTARAKGLSERAVVWKHAVRNGMMPIVTLLGTALPILLAGSVVIEYIFNIPGFGLLLINAINQNDYNVVMGVGLITAVLTLVGLLITDLTYAAMDPRISLR
jgi:peptide/nickel transport system permease protein